MEKLGIPTVIVQRAEFVGVTTNAFAGLGFPPEAAMVIFPVDLFLVDSDLTPVQDNFDKFVEGLTKWEPTIKAKGVYTPPKVTVEGEDYEDAAAKVNLLFLNKQWGDGLPLLPPTEERVNWILQGTPEGLSRDTVIGKVLPRGGIATVESLAVNLAMAGGRPEYLPVLIAAVEAMIDPALSHQSWQATSCSVFPVVIVNGPIARQIRLNSGFGLLGPDSTHPAGGAIGRALRLVQQNLGGAIPGVGTMAQYGGMRYTNAVFAEDEEGLPEGWSPLSVERFGRPKGANTVTVYPVSGAVNILRRGTGKEKTLEEEAVASLYIVASFMSVPNMNAFTGYVEGTPGILIMSRTIANQLNDLGWTKEKIKQFLWENSQLPWSEIEKVYTASRREEYLQNPDYSLAEGKPWPITLKPENIVIVVAGGAHPTHAYWLQASQGPKLVNVEIKLPPKEKWEELLKQAEKDLGPLPSQ